ncbi:uncharacterized protein G2W53_041468 [Senna tora]|uniref:Uncharacterized protein n=1 Tax=Senna tora TaxID=362788 RepID=A0A834VYT4_9FABA|nr:uncharacterized protein G2W53_041468 [Senna tora]
MYLGAVIHLLAAYTMEQSETSVTKIQENLESHASWTPESSTENEQYVLRFDPMLTVDAPCSSSKQKHGQDNRTVPKMQLRILGSRPTSSGDTVSPLFSDFQTNVDAAANGALMAKPVKEAYSLVEIMAANNFQWHSDRSASAKSVENQNNEALVTLTATIMNLATKIEGLSVQKPAHAVNTIMPRCEHCGEEYITEQCPLALESIQFLANRNANNNPYSNTYNPGSRNHPNFSWTQNSGLGPSSSVPCLPPEFHPEECSRISVIDTLSSSEFKNHSLNPLETALVLNSSELDEKELEQEEQVAFKMFNSIESPKDNEKCLKAKAVKEMGRKAYVIDGSKDHQIDLGDTPQKVLTESDDANQSGGPTMIKAPPWCHKSIPPHPIT